MKINELLNESTAEGRVEPEHKNPQGRIHKMRDVGGYDRTYHLNRFSMAMAMADGKSNKAVDMDEASWIEKYNTMHPYTDEEANMIQSALKTVPTDHKVISDDKKSREPDDVHRHSPVPHNSGQHKKTSKRK